MKMRWCWRCGMDVPMFDSEEFERIHEKLSECMRSVGDARRRGISTTGGMDAVFAPFRELHEEMTGWPDMHHNAVWHHRLSMLGPDCPGCGKPLRTPRAKLCPMCGWKKAAEC